MNAGRDLHQGGFPGPVLAHEGHHFPRQNLEIDAMENAHTRESLDDRFHPQERIHPDDYFPTPQKLTLMPRASAMAALAYIALSAPPALSA